MKFGNFERGVGWDIFIYLEVLPAVYHDTHATASCSQMVQWHHVFWHKRLLFLFRAAVVEKLLELKFAVLGKCPGLCFFIFNFTVGSYQMKLLSSFTAR